MTQNSLGSSSPQIGSIQPSFSNLSMSRRSTVASR
jgi:hypothetical protein